MILLQGEFERIMLQLDNIKIKIIFFLFQILKFDLLPDNLLVTYRLHDF